MGKFFTALKRGAQAMAEGVEVEADEKDATSGEKFVVAGKPVRCTHCSHDRFEEGRAQLHTAGLTFLNVEWLNRSAATLACPRCGRIEWFVEDPASVE